MDARLPSLWALLTAVTAAVVAAPAAPPAAAAEPVLIYRCTADGQLTLRDTPCRRGERQQVIRMQRPQDPPTPPAPAAPPGPADRAEPAQPPEPPPTRVVVIERPPPVYECITPWGRRYTSDSPTGNPRWVPLWTLGYPARYSVPHPQPPRPRPRHPDNAHLYNDLVFDGIGRSPPKPSDRAPGPPQMPPALGLALTPGTWIHDRCEPLPPAIVCERLRERWWELRRDRNSALQSERERMDAEQDRIKARLARDC
jgi:hypothetical protein